VDSVGKSLGRDCLRGHESVPRKLHQRRGGERGRGGILCHEFSTKKKNRRKEGGGENRANYPPSTRGGGRGGGNCHFVFLGRGKIVIIGRISFVFD